MKEYKFKPYSRTREVIKSIGEVVGGIIAFGMVAGAAYVFLAVTK